MKKNKGFVREIRIPRLSVTKLKAQRDDAERRAYETTKHRDACFAEVSLYADRLAIAVALIDKLNRMPTQPLPRVLGADVAVLEGLRLMSITGGLFTAHHGVESK